VREVRAAHSVSTTQRYHDKYMAKLKSTSITAKDLEEFASTNSDFDFEMRVLSLLQNAGLQCRHAGTYRDPVTDKIRQFDIRAFLHGGQYTLAMAVECKNLRDQNPLLLSAVPRTHDEAFHNVQDSIRSAPAR